MSKKSLEEKFASVCKARPGVGDIPNLAYAVKSGKFTMGEIAALFKKVPKDDYPRSEGQQIVEWLHTLSNSA